MSKRRIDFTSKLVPIFSELKAQGIDPFNSIEDRTPHQVYSVISLIDEEISGIRTSEVLRSGSFFICRIHNVTARAKVIGSYEVLIDRKGLYDTKTDVPLKTPLMYYTPGTVEGSRKIFKKGTIFLILKEEPPLSGNVVLLNSDSYLVLSRKSGAHRKLGFSIAGPLPEPYPEFTRLELIKQGFVPELTRIIEKPRKYNPNELVSTTYVRDAGVSLDNLAIAANISSVDFSLIADALKYAGRNNFPLLVPFDVKLEHIFYKIVSGRKVFTIIDCSTPAATPVFLSRWVTSFTQVSKNFAYGFLTCNSETCLFEKYSTSSRTNLDCAYCVVADTIISIFVCIAAAEEIQEQTIDTLMDQSILNEIVKNSLTKIHAIPALFISWPHNFYSLICESLKNAYLPDSRDWYGMFFTAFFKGKETSCF